MIYLMNDGKIVLHNSHEKASLNNSNKIGIFNYNDSKNNAENFDISEYLLNSTVANKSARFESHDNMDIICTPIIDFSSHLTKFKTIYIFIQVNSLFIICEDNDLIIKTIDEISNDESADLSLGKFLCNLFEHFTQKDSEYLDHVEQGINNLEDEIMLNKQRKNFTHSIISLRKKLMLLKRYYEHLDDIFMYIDGNENKLFDKRSLRSFKMLSGKIDRLYHNVLNLREYLTQIREAYQAEVDISLNTTMKLFTVITAVFSPLTLIVGWYGMNFNMPEFHWALGYPMVIGISICVVLACIIYFKKHKWF